MQNCKCEKNVKKSASVRINYKYKNCLSVTSYIIFGLENRWCIHFIRVSSNLLVERTCTGNKNRLFCASRTGRKRDTWLPLHRARSAPNNESPSSSLRTHLSSRRGTRRGRIWQVRGGSIEIATEIIYHGSRVRVTA